MKYNRKFLYDHLNNVHKYKKQPSLSYIKKYFIQIPHVFYKYRECNSNNFDALENNYLWLTPAIEVDDLLDSTIYFDIYKQRHRIKVSLERVIGNAIYKELKKHNIDMPELKDPNLQETMNTVRTLIYKNGKPKFGVIHERLKKRNIPSHQIKKIDKKLREYTSNENMEKQADKIIDAFTNINKLSRKNHYLGSLTLTKNNPKMWEDYAEMDEGFCIEYDISNLIDIDPSTFNLLYALQPIQYTKPKQFQISEAIDIIVDEQNGISNKESMRQKDIEIEMHARTKEKRYSFEEEWRFVFLKENIKKQKLSFPVISKIYLGMHIKNENKEYLIDFAKRKNIQIFQRKLNSMRNGFKYEKINIGN